MGFIMEEKAWITQWATKDHIDKKELMFSIVDQYLKSPPKCILDIGCGLAVESERFQKKYNSQLYLVDGDFEDTINRARKVNYGTVDSMAFYSKIEDLQKSWNSRNLNYTFINPNNMYINEDIKFDLIYSFESCGFHYPITTYKDFLKKHIDESTILIFDVRRKASKEQLEAFDIIDNINITKKYDTLILKFKQ